MLQCSKRAIAPIVPVVIVFPAAIRIEPARPAAVPLPVELPVPRVRLGPAAHRVPVLPERCDRPVGKRERRALFKEAGVIFPPAFVALEGFVNTGVQTSR